MRQRKIQSAGHFPPGRSNSPGFGRDPFFQLLIDIAAIVTGVVLACAFAAAIGVFLFFVNVTTSY